MVSAPTVAKADKVLAVIAAVAALAAVGSAVYLAFFLYQPVPGV
jgi:uncharacterized membrane protein